MKRTIVATGIAALVIAGGGAALAATGLGSSPQEESKAVIDDAASHLGVSSSKLSDALKQAFENRIDAAVSAGRITKAEGDEMKQRLESEDFPLLGGPGFGPHVRHGFPHLAAAATFLGVTQAELRTQLESGKTLADVAKAEGKTVDGLVAALVADEKKELDAAVAAGRLTRAQADDLLAGAEQRFTDLVNGTMPDRGPRGFGGPPGLAPPGSDA